MGAINSGERDVRRLAALALGEIEVDANVGSPRGGAI